MFGWKDINTSRNHNKIYYLTSNSVYYKDTTQFSLKNKKICGDTGNTIKLINQMTIILWFVEMPVN